MEKRVSSITSVAYKWQGGKRNFSVGDIVLVLQDESVIQVFKDSNGYVRSIKLRIGKTRHYEINRILERCVSKLVLLVEQECVQFPMRKSRNKDVRGSSEDNSSKCMMCNGWHGPDECKVFNDMTVEERKASSCLSRNYAMVVMKSSHQNTQQGTVQDEETVRFVWQSIQLAYMDTRLEGSMAVKVMMMMQERLSKTTVPTSKMFSMNQLQLEKL